MRSVKINHKKIKRIPLKAILFWFLFLIIFAFFMVNALRPANYWLKDLEIIQLKIDRVSLVDTYDIHGSRMKLYISSGDQNYYLWYPQGSYLPYSEVLDTHLLSGKTTVVTAKVIPNNIVREALGRRAEIVDLRTDDVVFFDIEDRIKSNQIDHIGIVILAFISGFMFILDTIFITTVYGVIEFGKPCSKMKG